MNSYTVTLKNTNDLEQFYLDMENAEGPNYIPHRCVDCVERMPGSANTVYHLTEAEAEALRKDSRVLAVEQTPPFKFAQCDWQRTQTFTKGLPITSASTNWGLLRCTEAGPRANWTSLTSPDFTVGFSEIGTPTREVTTNVTTPRDGVNVDIVIFEPGAWLRADHPEFAVNSDGSGGTRVQSNFNWFQYCTDIGIPANKVSGPYKDSLIDGTNTDIDHANAVAGVAAGNTCGWASSAKIYSIASSYGGVIPATQTPTTNQIATDDWYTTAVRLICAFHVKKPTVTINSVQVKTPTIVNMSWGFSAPFVPTDFIGTINFENTPHVINDWNTITNVSTNFISLTSRGLFLDYLSAGVLTKSSEIRIGFRDTSLDTAINEAAKAGVVFVGSAGNRSQRNATIKEKGFQNYVQLTSAKRNLLIASGYTVPEVTTTTKIPVVYYNRGASPNSADGVIQVGGISDAFYRVYPVKNIPSADGITGFVPGVYYGDWNLEDKVGSSNGGKRVDVFAPGRNIVTCLSSTNGLGMGVSVAGGSLVFDTRGGGSTYRKGSVTGTSFAAPQVAGILALYAEELLYGKKSKRLDYKTVTTKYLKKNIQKRVSDVPPKSKKYTLNKRKGFNGKLSYFFSFAPNSNATANAAVYFGLVIPNTNYGLFGAAPNTIYCKLLQLKTTTTAKSVQVRSKITDTSSERSQWPPYPGTN